MDAANATVLERLVEFANATLQTSIAFVNATARAPGALAAFPPSPAYLKKNQDAIAATLLCFIVAAFLLRVVLFRNK